MTAGGRRARRHFPTHFGNRSRAPSHALDGVRLPSGADITGAPRSEISTVASSTNHVPTVSTCAAGDWPRYGNASVGKLERAATPRELGSGGVTVAGVRR